MKIAFVSDTHFGYPRYEADASAQGRAAVLDACSKADVLVLGGDIFDHRVPRLETLGEVANLLQEAQKVLRAKWKGAADAPLVLGIHGTHERRAKDALNPIAMMAQLGLMADLHNQTTVIENGGEKVAFSGLGGIPDDLVKEALGRLSCKPAEGAANFFVFHQTMREFVPAAPNLASLEDLPPGYDWYLCGHLHAKQEWLGGRLLIPGSTVMTQMKEEESQPKGYYLIDTKDKKSEFVAIRTRPFAVSELAFDKAQPADVRKKVEEEIRRLLAQKWDGKPILRIRLSGSLAPAAGDLDLGGLDREEAFITIDNHIDGGSLAADLEKLKEERMHRATPRELGLSLLRQNAQAAGLDPKKAEAYFEEFSKEE
ncbi:MAG: metallophosphoesterase [Candidatus Micrarchaeota archaeon]|nr:metallophosphoesterase [Candidatus Micrarchaeota archaeon]